MRTQVAYWFLIAVVSITVAGCMAYFDPWEVRVMNRESLAQLAPGMSKEEALEVMGTETMEGDDGDINNPFRTELFQDDENTTVEVLYYYTDKKNNDKAITDDELTPVVLKNGRVVGWGWISLRKLCPIEVAAPAPVPNGMLP